MLSYEKITAHRFTKNCIYLKDLNKYNIDMANFKKELDNYAVTSRKGTLLKAVPYNLALRFKTSTLTVIY